MLVVSRDHVVQEGVRRRESVNSGRRLHRGVPQLQSPFRCVACAHNLLAECHSFFRVSKQCMPYQLWMCHILLHTTTTNAKCQILWTWPSDVVISFC